MRAKRAVLLVSALALLSGGCEQLAELFGKEMTPQEKATEAMNQARMLLQQGDQAGAEEAYRKAMTHVPDDSAPVLALAAMYEQRGEDTRAVLELRQAADLLSTDAAPRERIGDILIRQDRFGPAAEAYKRALDILPMSEPLGRKLALASLLGGQISDARREIGRLKGSDPAHPETQALDGLVMAAEGRGHEARSLIESAARASSEPAPSRLLGLYYLQMGEASAAVQALKGAQERGGSDPWTLRLLAQALIASGAGAEAVELLDPAVRARPRDPIVLAAYARALVARGQYEEALQAAGRAVRQNSGLGAAHLAQGDALEAMERYDQAARAYRSAVKASPQLGEAYRRLASLESRQGRMVEAAAALERLVALSPGDRRAQVELLEAYAAAPSEARKGLDLVDRLLAEEPQNTRFLQLRAQMQAEVKRRPSGGRAGPVIMR
ncbi:MAG: tetratricopeptide repeat protein [Deltaproteobacteria bacterium]|nr:tetratricopeptide repeat protein [Deltaproteobacteria bacterium]